MRTAMNKLLVAGGMMLMATLSSCYKDLQVATPSDNGSVKVQFTYVKSDGRPWSIGQPIVQSKTGDTLNFSELKFYVSNVKLVKADGTSWTAPAEYYLVDAKAEDVSSFSLRGVPMSDYVAIQFTLGADNPSVAQTGAFALSNGMFWDNTKGYMSVKVEGTSVNSPNGAFMFHLGGNGATTVKTTAFDKTVQMGMANNNTLTLSANPDQLWNSSPNLKTRSSIDDPSPEAAIMANDFYNSISFVSVK